MNDWPKSLNISGGHTVKWEGDFSTHPLISTIVPAGAASFHHTSGTGIGGEPGSVLPNTVRREQNSPNPFNARTTTRFDMPSSQRVTLEVYSILGKEMAALTAGVMPAGSFTVSFDASALAGGVYYYRMVTEQHTDTRQFVLSK